MHFVYTREGVARAMGLRSVNGLGYHIKKAKQLGVNPSKIIGGVEYFDIDIVEDPESFATEEKLREVREFVEKQIREHPNQRLQLSLF